MHRSSCAILLAGLLACAIVAAETAPGAAVPSPSFADFDRRAQAGESLTVVFFGCSLTWGANSTDPVERSYRAHVARRLQARYPAAQWRFIDAAIGGTDSRLGIFRMERDVVRHKPDLVFLDFTLNDEPSLADPDHLASYEAIVRRCVADLKVPTVQMFLCSKDMVACLDLERFRTRTAHIAISKAYGTAIGDAFALMQDRLRAGRLDLDQAWDNPQDGCHPGDLGYELYAEAAWQGYTAAVTAKLVCTAPERLLNADTYRSVARVRLSTLAPLPTAWSPAKPTRISAWYDSLMSRWLDEEVLAKRPAKGALPDAWELKFRGATALLYGESTVPSGHLRVLIDGQPANALKNGILVCTSPAGGTFKLNATLATGLAQDVDHTIRMEPIAPGEGACEWRLESLCVAGSGARVWR